jgi:ribosomal-protein-alanine N-acetyltransferase
MASTNYHSICTDRLLLRSFKPTDLECVFEGLSHPDVIKFYGVQYDSLAATQAQMDWFAALEKDKTGQWWAICSPDDAAFYGACGYNNWSHQHQKAEIGFWLLPQHQGKGIIGEALPLIIDYAFKIMGLHRIEAMVETPNHASKKVLLRAGFVQEGTLLDCEIKNGQFISLYVFAKLNKV